MKEKKNKIKKDLFNGVICKEGNRQTAGITLIALIVTIVILLILAGISIQAITNAGLFANAKKSKEESKRADADEQLKLMLYEWSMERAEDNIALIDFLNKKVEDSKIEDVEETDEGIEVYLDGYVVILDETGNILEEIQKAVEKPQIMENTINATLTNGDEIIARQELGTPIKVTFTAKINGGTILRIDSPTGATVNTQTGIVTYTTTGNEREVKFEIVGSINGVESKAKRKVSLVNYYENIIEADSLLKAIADNTFLEDEKCKIEVKNVIYSLHVFNYDNNLTISENTEFGDASIDVATSSLAKAKNMVVVKVNGDLTINSGVTVSACKNINGYGGPKGMLIYCTGTLTNNGTISMSARGACADGQDVYLWKNSENNYEFIPKDGGSGGEAVTNARNGDWYAISGKPGNQSTIHRGTGGGGSGGTYACYATANSGSGGVGTSYSGGGGRRCMWCSWGLSKGR